jgi:hypothetical protein
MKFIPSKNLRKWVDEREPQGLLPHLFRKLIFATSKHIEPIYFPEEYNILLGGFDGF